MTDPSENQPKFSIEPFRVLKTKTVKELFDGPRLKVERAKRHIGDYRAAAKTFAESDNAKFNPELDMNTRQIVYRIIFNDPDTGAMQVAAADVLYNLRSALDQVISRCAIAAGESPDETYFPHGKDLAGFKASLRKKCKKIPKPICDAIAALEPYYGGNGFLIRALHDLNIVDKHTDLIAVGPSVRDITIEHNVPIKDLPPGRMIWQHRNNKLEIADASQTTVHQNVNVALAITFTEVEAIKGQSVTKILQQMTDLVARTIGILGTALVEWKTANP